ncbi:hypothetical protein A2V54_03730 [candidate division WWE3 bacterium RBG_19FT_COMBO_53_11]|uniref:Peptidase C45 hydrolase domain-containing protein n=1 Tax=candidate division WWE3 bacterium RBG_19FT_COMBO_53_11 TaxID=1802613 RepID=A0A1F4UI44_UNCKA|nr:MAG: hypothetical protein A2155_01600 [candidate division WWE3 bacterium RBG_16_52_45]OGC44577.1 MAG: hypothetical protein A2V54_03730 [candidate division WWE3 bacterium RBG_19FT_COMBO_53_11]
MDLIEVRGDHYQIGLQIGQATASKIAAVLSPKPLSPGFQKRVAALAPVHERAFPHLFAEILGMAVGSDQNFEKLLAWNLFEQTGCTSILSLGRGGFLSHNEDGDAIFRNRLTLVKMHLPDGDTALCLQYPGELCGNAVSVTSRGMVFSINFLWPKQFANLGYNTNFLARELLGAPSLEGVQECLAAWRPRIDAYHWFVYSRLEKKALSIEVLKDRESVVQLEKGIHLHTNHYLHADARDEPQEEYPSSRDRLERLSQFFTGHATGERAQLALSDHKGKWPICRHGGEDSWTLANISVDLDTLKMEIAEGPTCMIRKYFTASV